VYALAAGLALVVAMALLWGRLPFSLRLKRAPDAPVVLFCSLAGMCRRWQLSQAGDISAWLERVAACGAWPGRSQSFATHLIGHAAGRRQLARLVGVARAARLLQLDARARLGTGDAAATALLIGWCWTALGLLRPLLGGTAPRLRLEPDFNHPWLELDVQISGDLPLGRTLLVGACVGGEALRWRIRRIAGTWTHDIKAQSRRRRRGGVRS
jgi:hypothetical protein